MSVSEGAELSIDSMDIQSVSNNRDSRRMLSDNNEFGTNDLVFIDSTRVVK